MSVEGGARTRRDGYDGVGDLLAKIRLCRLLHPRQHHGADLFWGLHATTISAPCYLEVMRAGLTKDFASP